MTNMIYGVGDPFAKSTTLAGETIAQEVMYALNLFAFEYSVNTSKLEAKVQKKGIKRLGASAIGEEIGTVKLSAQVVDWGQMGFFLNQRPGTKASVSVPVLKTATVPSSSPYEITDTAITSGTAAGVYVYVTDGTDPGYRTITSGTIAAGTAKVDGSTGKITLHSSDAGRAIAYTVPVTHTNAPYYGGDNDLKIGTIEFYGTVYGTGQTIYFPSLDFNTTPSISLTGDVATLEVELSANVVGTNNYPYILYDV